VGETATAVAAATHTRAAGATATAASGTDQTPTVEPTLDPNLPATGQSTLDTLGLVVVLGLAALLVGSGVLEVRRRL
jgi:hypothetical protein